MGKAEAFCPGIVRHLRKDWQYIVVTNYSDPTGLLAIGFMKAKRIPYIIEGDGAFPKTKKDLRAKLKYWAISGADLCFSTGRMHDTYYHLYGAKRIVRYPFSSVMASEILKAPLSAEGKACLRKKLGISEKQMVLAVGQLIPRKGYDLLMRAAEVGDHSIGYYIIGGNPPEPYVKEKTRARLDRLHFIPFKTRDKLRQYYLAADLFVHPCREDIWGLVINEALSSGLPVISTDRCNAALELVRDGVNGRIIPTEDSEALADAIKVLLSGPSMAFGALQSVQDYTIEKMAEKHKEVFLRGPG